MKFALVDPTHPAYDYNDNLIGYRLMSTNLTEFEVCPPLFWLPCADDVQQNTDYYDTSDETIKPFPQPVIIDNATGQVV